MSLTSNRAVLQGTWLEIPHADFPTISITGRYTTIFFLIFPEFSYSFLVNSAFLAVTSQFCAPRSSLRKASVSGTCLEESWNEKMRIDIIYIYIFNYIYLFIDLFIYLFVLFIYSYLYLYTYIYV